ncbi:MAG: GAF domain-containing protein [Firmicutes bacterium]|nr:GAF domain-containing protein [Bacillota bacterium]
MGGKLSSPVSVAAMDRALAQFLLQSRGRTRAGTRPMDVLRQICQWAVPAAADRCAVMAGAGGQPRAKVVLARAHPAGLRIAVGSAQAAAMDRWLLRAAEAVIVIGRPVLWPEERPVARKIYGCPARGDGAQAPPEDGLWPAPGDGDPPVSCIAVPLLWSRRPQGAIVLASDRHRYGPDDVAFLEVVAAHAALLLGNVRLAAARAGRRSHVEVAKIKAMAAAAASINRQLSVEGTVRKLTEHARAVIGASRAAAVLFDAGDSPVQAVSVSSVPEKEEGRGSCDMDGLEHLIQAGVRIAGSLSRPCALTRREMRRHRAWSAEAARQPGRVPLDGWLAVPMMGRNGRRLGLLQLWGKERGEFDGADEAIALDLAQLGAVAVENALLYQQVRVAKQRLKEQLEFTTAITRTIGEGLYAVDCEGRLTFMNPAAERKLGWTAADVLGQSPHQVFHYRRADGTSHPVDECRLLGVLRTGEPYRTDEDVYIRKDGTVFPISATATPIIQHGRVTGAVVAFRDISRLKETQRQLEELTASLERRVQDRTAALVEANQELEAFAYSVSHDLRAPLRTINGFSQALLEDYGSRLDDTGRDYLARVQAATKRMSELIDSMLYLSRVTRVELVRQDVNLSQLAREIARELQERDPRRRIEFCIEDGLTVRGDRRLLRVVLENLLENAWKFSGTRAETVIEFGRTWQDERPVYFVRDNGVGFDMRYADKLFGVFQRLHGAGEFEGNGIGLATVQRIIRRHGGEVWGVGEEGRGATFFFTV